MRAKNFTASQRKRIEKQLPRFYQRIWRLMCATGLRVGDAVSVCHGDIDIDGYLHYTAEKTGKRARVKLSDEIYNELCPENSVSVPMDYIFKSPYVDGAHISRQAVWKAIKKACREAKINPDGISPHSCRKNFAVNSYEKEGLSSTMAKLQHSSPNTTFLYLYDDNPIEYLEKRLKKTEKELKTIKKQLKRVLYALDLCCDRLLGDDVYGVTDEGRKVNGLDFNAFIENI